MLTVEVWERRGEEEAVEMVRFGVYVESKTDKICRWFSVGV